MPRTRPPAADNAARFLGLDPGLGVTGYGVLEATRAGLVVVEAGVIRPIGTDLAERVRSLYDSVTEVLAAFRPQAVAVEQLYAHYDHPRTAILMGHARGVLLLAAVQAGLTVASYAATRVKKTLTGHGRATKEQMQLAVQREFGLAALPEPPDVADALAVALCDYHARRKTS